MMIADPGRVEADFLGPQRLGVDVLDEVLGRARIVGIAVVAQREVTELHGVPSCLADTVRRFQLFVNANNESVGCDPVWARVRTPTTTRNRMGDRHEALAGSRFTCAADTGA